MFLANISSRLLDFLGVDHGNVPKDANLEFTFTNLPQSWTVFVFLGVAAALVGGVFWIYRREKSDASRWPRRFLALLRASVFLLLLVILLGPSVTYKESQILRRVIPILRDESLSMGIKEEIRDPSMRDSLTRALGGEDPGQFTRADVVNQLINPLWLEEITKKGRWRMLNFSQSVSAVGGEESVANLSKQGEELGETPSDGDESNEIVPLVPVGGTTDLALALNEALQDKLTSAAIIFTDGQHNGANNLEEAIEKAAMRQVPIFLVATGDLLKPRDASVAQIYADPQVWKGDPFEISATLGARQMEGETVRIELVALPDPDENPNADAMKDGVVLDSREVVLPEDGRPLPLRFTHRPEKTGPLFLNLRIAESAGEMNLENNVAEQSLRVEVLDDKARVLLIAGTASWEYRALTRFFMREETVDLSCWLQSLSEGRLQQGNTVINSLPVQREDLFAYDAVILLDPNPVEFSPEWIESLAAFVEKTAGGLLYMPGPLNSGEFLRDPRSSEIVRLLPVELEDVGRMQVDAMLSTYERQWNLQPVPAQLDHPLLRFFADSVANADVWRKLSGTFWSFPASTTKPGSRILLEHSDLSLRLDESARPLMVAGYQGAGRTVFLGLDGTWRWRTEGFDAEYYKRFWVQTVRFLVEGRALAGKRRGSIDASRLQYEIGNRAELTATLRQSTFEPWQEEQVTARLTTPDGEESELTFVAVPERDGVYAASINLTQEGAYLATITLEDGEAVEISTSFRAQLPIRESRETWVNRELLERIAGETGGKFVLPDQVGEIPSLIPDGIRRLETQQPPIPLWDSVPAFSLLIGLLGLEWGLRKRMKML